jgi:hypothetical protein
MAARFEDTANAEKGAEGMSIEQIKFRGQLRYRYDNKSIGDWITTDELYEFLLTTWSSRFKLNHEFVCRQVMAHFWGYLVKLKVIDPATVGQWTGFLTSRFEGIDESKCKNIYAGDIVEGCNNDYSHIFSDKGAALPNIRGEVYFSKAYGQWRIKNEISAACCSDVPLHKCHDSEIIGNIHTEATDG